MLIRKYGRLPVLFWSQVPHCFDSRTLSDHTLQLISLGLLVGCAFSSNLTTFAG